MVLVFISFLIQSFVCFQDTRWALFIVPFDPVCWEGV